VATVDDDDSMMLTFRVFDADFVDTIQYYMLRDNLTILKKGFIIIDNS